MVSPNDFSCLFLIFLSRFLFTFFRRATIGCIFFILIFVVMDSLAFQSMMFLRYIDFRTSYACFCTLFLSFIVRESLRLFLLRGMGMFHLRIFRAIQFSLGRFRPSPVATFSVIVSIGFFPFRFTSGKQMTKELNNDRNFFQFIF